MYKKYCDNEFNISSLKKDDILNLAPNIKCRVFDVKLNSSSYMMLSTESDIIIVSRVMNWMYFRHNDDGPSYLIKSIGYREDKEDKYIKVRVLY